MTSRYFGPRAKLGSDPCRKSLLKQEYHRRFNYTQKCLLEFVTLFSKFARDSNFGNARESVWERFQRPLAKSRILSAGREAFPVNKSQDMRKVDFRNARKVRRNLPHDADRTHMKWLSILSSSHCDVQ